MLGWLARTGRSTGDAVREFWPDAAEDERDKLDARIRKWRSRAATAAVAARERARAPRPELRIVRRGEEPPAPAPASKGAEPEAPPDLASMTASAQARWQLAEIARQHRICAKRSDARGLVSLDQRLSELRAELEEARRREGVGAAPLTPLPSAVALDLLGRDRQIAALAALAEQIERETSQTQE